MMAKVRVELNKSAARQLLRSQDVQDDLRARAERIAAAAGDGFEVESNVGTNRARVIVISTTVESMLAEANDRALTRAIDAGR